MSVLDQYRQILGQLPNYEPRPSQERMVEGVSQAMETNRSLIIEAGTGSGKSFGYLVPILLQTRRPVVISTGTIALQEQLLNKDIPFLSKTLGRALTVRLVKGRGNYLCIQKLLEAEREWGRDPAMILHINAIKAELEQNWDGDWASLDWSIPREFWDEVKSDSEDCLGRRCQFWDRNPFRLAREDLERADIIIANHALYCQDLIAGRSLLPPHDFVVFDEAHSLKGYALNGFTTRLGKYATTRLLSKLRRRLTPVPDEFIFRIRETEAQLLRWLFNAGGEYKTSFRLRADEDFLDMVHIHQDILSELLLWVQGIDVKQLSIVETELDADRATVQRNKLIDQLNDMVGRWEHFLERDESFGKGQRVNWAELDRKHLYFELRSTPLNVADVLKSTCWDQKTAVLTSATLSVNNRLDFYRQELGLPVEQADELVLPSPFNFPRQCLLYLPSDNPDAPDDPNDPRFVPAMAEDVVRLLEKSSGRAFVLFTSFGNMRAVADLVIPRLPFACRVQGEMPRNRLIEWFKTTTGSVLFATSTFWEGIDVPGDALSCVIIDKIPFTAPDDPIHQATVELLKRQGRRWFEDYALPQAVIRIKQGFGRLIRTQTDRGVVAILDPRLRTRGYGRQIINSLPPVQVIHRLDDLPEDFFPAVDAEALRWSRFLAG
jgi:ATP-dependent DNA helicase DinG